MIANHTKNHSPLKLFSLALVTTLFTVCAQATQITIQNNDGAGEGFNDPTVVAPAPGNPGTTLGQQRLNVFLAAAEYWEKILKSDVEIIVASQIDPLTCSLMTGTLGSAGPIDATGNFANAPVLNTWYPIALANSLAGTDLVPANADINATFNSRIGTDPTCLPGLNWWYGIGSPPVAGTVDFYNTVLHEIGHGLGFLTFVNTATGAKLSGFDDHFMRHLRDLSLGLDWPNMTNAQRVASAIDDGDLVWTGPKVIGDVNFLTTGVNNGFPQMYAPNPREPGSSVSHWDTDFSPDELMEPILTNSALSRATVNAYQDMGWMLNSLFAVTWSDNTPGNNEVYIKASTDQAASWKQTRLSNTSTDTISPTIGTGGDNIYVVYADDDAGHYDLFLKRSTDIGQTFETKKKIVGLPTNSHGPSLSTTPTGTNIYLAWQEATAGDPGNIYFRRSTDSGSTFQAIQILSSTADEGVEPDIISQGEDKVYLAWSGITAGNGDIFFRRSTTSGATWRPRRTVSSTSGDSRDPALAVNGNIVHLVWKDATSDNGNILYKRSTDEGETWPAFITLSGTTGESSQPDIAVDGDNVYVVWWDNVNGDKDIWYKVSTDSGLTFSSRMYIANTSADSNHPSIKLEGDIVLVTFSDQSLGNAEINYRLSLDGATSWNPRRRITNTAGQSITPEVAN